MRENVKDGFKLGGHDMNFKPAKDINRRVKADFDHKTDLDEKKKNYKDAEGQVIVGPRNFLTNGVKKGQVGKNVYIGEKIPYKEDPYDNKKELEKAERKAHHDKLQEKPFSQRVKHKETFATVKEAFGEDRHYPARPPPAKRVPLMEHEVPFYPSKPPRTGIHKTLDKFPPYIEDPKKPVERKRVPEGQEERPKFRMTHNHKTVPCQSVVTITKNLKSEFPSVFRKF